MQKMTALFSAALLSVGMISAPAMAQQDSATAQQDPAATEQDSATQQAPATTQQPQVSSEDFSDEQLQKFADTSQEIAMISQDYTERLQNAKDQTEQQEIRMEANDEMVSTVEDSGMTVEEFNAIGQAIQQDPELMQRVQAMAAGK